YGGHTSTSSKSSISTSFSSSSSTPSSSKSFTSIPSFSSSPSPVNVRKSIFAPRPTAAPAVAAAPMPCAPNPAAPIDCSTATVLPAATPPPLATAAADMRCAPIDPAAIPAPVKPKTTGAAATAATVTVAPATKSIPGRYSKKSVLQLSLSADLLLGFWMSHLVPGNRTMTITATRHTLSYIIFIDYQLSGRYSKKSVLQLS
ncbi:anti-sigma-I factor RsgI2-like, partial [Anneissia japonica]|uniref:anti-sigma-I factor RsgI2-like n=1 Tax=Anneissia japonica TaxID=1529436 RepID=UPI0014255A19